ncbi:hypothetical protein XPA_008357 [Xanthoria parietina]
MPSVGLSATEWDDCASAIFEPNEQFQCAGLLRESPSPVGTSSGNIVMYSAETCQETQRLRHCEPVRLLHFGSTAEFLAAAGATDSSNLGPEPQTSRCGSSKRLSCACRLQLPTGDELLLGALKNNHSGGLGPGIRELCETIPIGQRIWKA